MSGPGRASRTGSVVRTLLFLAVLAGTAWFFSVELHANWASIRQAGLRFRAGGMALALVLVIASYLLVALAWHAGINARGQGEPTGLGTSMAVVNVTQLTKYLPGKVWSYAVQMFLMEGRGVPKTFVLYVNLLVTLSMLLLSAAAGSVYLLLYPAPVPPALAAVMLAGVLVTYSGMLFLNGKVMRAAVRIIGRVFGTVAEFFELPLPVLLRMQVPLVAASALFGLAACAACSGIGIPVTPDRIFPVVAVTLFADLLGFVTLLAPGGLGVREGAMFLLLGGVAGRNAALLLPLALRAVTLASDLLLGLSAFALFRKHVMTKR